MKVAITNLQNKISLSLKKIESIAKLVLSGEGSLENISIAIIRNNKIRILNKRFMKKDRPTDVLAFSFTEGKFSNLNLASLPSEQADLLGDVVVSIDAAITNAKLYKTTPEKELYLYVIHGILHLLGYDDTTPGKRVVMKKKEQYYLTKSKIK